MFKWGSIVNSLRQLRNANAFTKFISREIAFNEVCEFNPLQNPQDFAEKGLEKKIQEQQMTNDKFWNLCGAMNISQREIFNLLTTSIQNQMTGSENRLV